MVYYTIILVMKTFHVHFVCSGNAYRSRLAEAYLRSKKLPNITVSSSGIEAKKHYSENGPITWYAMRLLKRHDLIPHAKPMSTQTTSRHLSNADIVIFMTDEQHKFAKEKLKFDKNSFEIWHIDDIDDADFFGTKDDTDLRHIEHSELTFTEIKKKVDELASKIKHANR